MVIMANFPREGNVVLGGHPWLARMLDKARLDAAGEIAQYDLDYNCPMDKSCLSKLGLDAKTFQQLAVENKTDADVLAALAKLGVAVAV
jgi:hypothetical protein